MFFKGKNGRKVEYNYKNFNSGLFTSLVDGISLRSEPLTEKQIKEANEKGLVALSRTNLANYNLYRFVTCNHIQLLQPTHVRRGHFTCKTCALNEIVESCNHRGLHFLSKDGDDVTTLRQCGHVYRTKLQVIKKLDMYNLEKCKDCYWDNFRLLCISQGYTYLGKKDRHNYTVEFNECKHKKDIQLSQVYKNNLVCRVCIDSAFSKAVSDQRLEVISWIRPKGRVQVKLPCGCVKRARLSDINDYNCFCHACNGGRFQKESYVYLYKFTVNDYSWLKLGFSVNPQSRIRCYGLPYNTVVLPLSIRKFETGIQALNVEQQLHKQYKPNRLTYSLMKNYHSVSGFTECYTTVITENLIHDLSLVGIPSDLEM